MPTVRYIKNDFPDAMEITNDGETRRYVPERTACVLRTVGLPIWKSSGTTGETEKAMCESISVKMASIT